MHVTFFYTGKVLRLLLIQQKLVLWSMMRCRLLGGQAHTFLKMQAITTYLRGGRPQGGALPGGEAPPWGRPNGRIDYRQIPGSGLRGYGFDPHSVEE